MELINFTEILEEFGKKTIEGLRNRMSLYELGDSKLANSLEYNVEGNRIVIDAAGYWQYAEKGRGPGGVPYDFADIIEQWARRRNFNVDDTMRFAQNVKWKTIREGSYIYRHPEQARDFEGDVIEKNLDELSKKLAIYIKDAHTI